MIKRIGTAAREELERFFATRVFLDLHVRVKADWREDERVLERRSGSAAYGCRIDALTVHVAVTRL